MKINELKPEFVEFIPEKIENGILYISTKYLTSIHNCCCGECGNKTVLNFDSRGWKFTNNNGLISFEPSIGNWQFKCRSHYYIRDNKIIWL